MKLEDLGIKPALFSQATHLVHFQCDNCQIIVPCTCAADADRYKKILTKHYAEQQEAEPA